MSKAEIMLIMILFHDSGYQCLKHFYLEKVCRDLRHLFPQVVSYNRFIELQKEVVISLALFIKKGAFGETYKYQLCEQHTASCLPKPEDTYS